MTEVVNRPGQWDLLNYGSDPVAVDVGEIDRQAGIYSGFADTLEEQITALNHLANPDERLLVGDYADKIQEASEELSEHLGKLKGRFAEVGGHLSSWAGSVHHARSETKSALTMAEQAMDDKPKGDDAPPPLAPGAVDPDLKPAIDKAVGAMNDYDDEAGRIADKIRDSSDDDMKDSRWDKFKDWVSGFAGMLDAICDVLGWIAAAIVIAVLIFSGPGGWLLLAAALGALALAGHTLLAMTGNGSWLDVAFDAISLVTMGMGGRALKAANLARTTVLKTAGKEAGKQAYNATMTRGLLRGGQGVIGRGHLALRQINPIRQLSAGLDGLAARFAFTTRALPEAGIVQRAMAGGDQELAGLLKELPELTNAARNLVSPTLMSNLTSSVNAARNFSLAGLATDFGSLAMNPKIGEHELYDLPPHEWLEDKMTFHFKPGSFF